ncbi:hypothetical protein SLEP1_g35809 [Rubroshorea leprosula]|uniref:Tubulin alpha-6 chain n=1 Tax=Rubroshorea leprosula TaxID=152421 RepID=A0AAV5KPG2_9ROSI|nr:hypothetical protein SLEP1_g35809 [Rubroshorea leprosula]
MGSLQILNPTLSLFSISQSNFHGKFDSRKRILRLRSNGCSRYFGSKRFKIRCAVQEDDNQNKGEERPESLFMKELKKRGITPTSSLEDAKRGNYVVDKEMKVGDEEGGGFSKGNAVSTDYERNLTNQREESMQLNSEGLEGLIPRAKLLLSLGGTFFLAFGPLILVTVAFFSAIYLYFGSSFVHDASNKTISPPQYIDPYALLEDERISQTAPRIN